MSAPEIRFPEFKEPWRPTVAGAAFKHSRARGEAGLPIYSVTLDRGMVRRDSLDRHMESDAADGQNLRAQPGDIVYNMMRMWQGAVGVAPEECMVSPAYVVLRPTKETNPQFFNYWFQTSRMLHKLGAYSHGLTKDRLRLYPDDFSKIPLHLPTRAEQDRIATFFEDIDAKLAALREQADGLRQFKTGMMQRLFSQELRFTRADGSDFPDWEEKRLGEISSLTKGADIAKSDISPEGQFPCIHYGDLFRVYGPVIHQVKTRTDSLGGKVGRKGDVLIPASDVTPTGLCTASALMQDDVKLSGDINIIRPKKGINSPWLSYGLIAKRRDVLRLITGTTVKHLYGSDLSKLKLSIPHLDEQEKIAGTLMVIDAKIDAVMDQITHMETFKKGLLQKMFV